MGVLSDPYTMIIVNLVAWISFLVMVYSLDYMKGDSGLTRYWFFMNFFIGSMQLIVLSDNLLSLFIGWEGVGLCSYALIGFHYQDETENWVGTPGQKALGEEQAYPPSHAGMKAFFMTQDRRHGHARRAPHPLHLRAAPSTSSSSRRQQSGRSPSRRTACSSRPPS